MDLDERHCIAQLSAVCGKAGVPRGFFSMPLDAVEADMHYSALWDRLSHAGE